MEPEYDVAVVGAGPGGYIAAIRCAQLGLKTVCIDEWQIDGRPAPGGTCTNVGCIPSKAMLEASAKYEETKTVFPSFGIQAGDVRLDMPQMQSRRAAIVRQTNEGILWLFRKNRITFISGKAQIAGKEGTGYRLKVASGTSQQLTAAHLVIATGSKPRAWQGLPFDESAILSNTGVLALDTVPRKLAVIGAGVVGLELGSVWRRLGAEVTLFESLPAILPGADSEIAAEAQKQLARQGLNLLTGVSVQTVQKTADGVAITYSTHQGTSQQAVFDKVLVSIGRVPNTEGLGIEAIGLSTDDRGFIQVDGQCRTTVPNVWAIGDVVRGPMLAHKAEEEGVAVAERIAGKSARVDFNLIPWVVYTHPEIAWVGQTEETLKAAGRDIKVGKFPFMANGRARTMGSTEGFVKTVADARTGEILGVHMIGSNVSELVAEAAVAMAFRASSEDIACICHAHPTLSEAVRESALNVQSRALNQ